ncbi:hypothetical protein BDN72DRAFT_10241 [Pluteus cervinus]|uniref:Uncharacterized protein n=1 Tax=Pluteus cervinus TaxID=181527 RepID=A0ACD3BF18_9AGAR|nr:hypothetical protein BDN72DRAFT_10241 [Pluteus cervinus]
MKFLAHVALVSAVSLPSLVAASAQDSHRLARDLHVQHARQQAGVPPPGGPQSSSAPAAQTSSAAAPPPPAPPATSTVQVQSTSAAGTPAPAPATSNGAATTTGAATTSPTTTYHYSLDSVNPTAVPLSDIVSDAAVAPTHPLDATFTPGAQPTFLPGAPGLPNAMLLKPTDYPALDKIPPTDSPQVQEWISEVAKSGVPIPNIPVNVAGGCPANPQAASDPSRCWWTCGGCTRSTDITECPQPMHWGLTYDDGPSYYTPDLLSYLDQVQLKSTFYIVGSRAISFPQTLQTQFMGQHQIAVHTWSHPSLTTLTNEQIIAELGWSKKVIKDVLGVTPNTMRPPYGDIDDRVRAISVAMGLTPVMWTRISPLATYDTDDFNIHSGITPVGQVLQNWENILGNATTSSKGFIVLEHDLFQQTVEVATGYILPDALGHQPPFTIQPVITCLGLPLSDAYIETNDNKTNPPPAGSASAIFTGPTVALSPTGGTDGGSPNGAMSVSSNVVLSTLLTGAVSLLAGYLSVRL